MDYNIYIHDKTSGQNKPTQPKQTNGGTNTKPKKKKEEESPEMIMAGKVMVAIVIAAKVAKSAFDVIVPLVARETGDYRFTTAAHNFLQTLKNANPANFINYTVNRINYYQENMLINNRQEQQRLLVGDSYLNDVSRKV